MLSKILNKKHSKNEVTYRHRFLIDFWSIFGPFLEPKSLQNRFRSGFGRALNEDSVSKLKKERSGSIGTVQTGRNFGSGKGEQGRGFNCPHTPDNLSKDRGWRILRAPPSAAGPLDGLSGLVAPWLGGYVDWWFSGLMARWICVLVAWQFGG